MSILLAVQGWSFLSTPPLSSPKVLSVDDLSCWLYTVWIACWEILRTSALKPSRTFHTFRYVQYACRTNTTHSKGRQTGVHAIQYVTKWHAAIQLWKLEISTGWVGSLCQWRTFSVGRWMMEKKRNGVEGLESIHINTHTCTQWFYFERVQCEVS